jgi:hypothetical protein
LEDDSAKGGKDPVVKKKDPDDTKEKDPESKKKKVYLSRSPKKERI